MLPEASIAIDAVGIRSGGGQSVLLGLIDAMCSEPRIQRIVIFASPPHRRDFGFVPHAKLVVIEQGWADRSYLHRCLWSEWGLSWACRSAGVSSVLCTTGTGLGRETPHIPYIQQSLPFEAGYQRALPPLQRLRLIVLKMLMARSCKRAERVVVQTAHMARVVTKAFGVAPERVVVAPPQVQRSVTASDCTEGVNAAEGISGGRPLLLYVGSAARHKNLRVLLESIKGIRAHFPEASIVLTCLRPSSYPEPKGIVWLGALGRSTIFQLMRDADALVMPSLYETACLPLVEAMANGLPILAADRPYAREICEDAAFYFDPDDPESLVRCCLNMLKGADVKNSLRVRGERRWRQLENAGGYGIAAREVLRRAGVV